MEETTISKIAVSAYRVPLDEPEADGTLEWRHTDVVLVHITAGNQAGLGWSYAPKAAAGLISDLLDPAISGRPAGAIGGHWETMWRCLRNAGATGMGFMAIAAVDIALWDLKARLLNVPLVRLFGPVREAVSVYGSGGFTNLTDSHLTDQLQGWTRRGISQVKMKVGRDAAADRHRVRVAREAIGDSVKLFVDANGGYARKEALQLAEYFAVETGVSWFEEPVSSNDLEGLRLLRDRGPAGMDIAAGEYGDTPQYFLRMLKHGAVDCLQADATRCGGYTGFLKAAALCEAFEVPLSAHCAPQIHAHVGCAVRPLRHVEYFHDHERIDRLLFDGVLEPVSGRLQPDGSRMGHGLSLRESDAERFRV